MKGLIQCYVSSLISFTTLYWSAVYTYRVHYDSEINIAISISQASISSLQVYLVEACVFPLLYFAYITAAIFISYARVGVAIQVQNSASRTLNLHV